MRLLLGRTSFIMIFVALGCSTTHRTATLVSDEFAAPPTAFATSSEWLSANHDFESVDLYLNQIAKENPSITTSWWVDYRRALNWSKKDKHVACENFSRLATEPNFPLRRLAYLRAHEICPKDNALLARLETFQVDTFDSWLTEPALDIAIEKAKEKNNREELVQLHLRKSKTNMRKEDKVSHTSQALYFAKKLNLKGKIKELESRLYNLSPSMNPKPSKKDYLNVANDYRYLRNFKKAEEYYERIFSDAKISAYDKIYALRGLRMSYKIQQNRPQALATTERLARYVEQIYKKSKKTDVDAKLFVDAHLQLARALWTEGQTPKAIQTLEKIEKLAYGKTSLAEPYWLRGRIEEESLDYAASSEWFKKALNDTIENQSFRDRVSWSLAWNQRKMKSYAETIRILREMQSHEDSAFDRNQIRFWLANTLKLNGEDGESQAEFTRLIEDDPFTFYGLIAHREIGAPLPSKSVVRENLKNAQTAILLPARLQEQMDKIYFDWLIAANENVLAGRYLDFIAEKVKREHPLDQESWVALFRLYAFSKNYLPLFNQFSTLDGKMRRQILEERPELVFPLPYYDTVAQASNRFGVSVEFIYSIMRQESAFNPLARSQMDAFGLMQLLPEVAKRSAAANAIEFQNAEDLYQPHVNIPIGSAHLRELWDKYNGEPVLAVASYNASEKAILTWLKTRYRGDTLEFIEDVPYDETRDYIKLVLRNYITYKILSNKDEKMIFPEWTLRISQMPGTF